MWPVAISVNGVALDLEDVLSDVTIRHGGSDIFTPPDPSACQITLLGVDRSYTRPFRVGGAIAIDALDGATTARRFTGHITDARLVEDALTIIGVGNLATLWRHTVGAGAWPAETWSARVTRAFTEAGLAASLSLEVGLFNPILAARPANPVALSDYLPELCATVGAVAADLPDGKILVQAIAARSFASPLTLDSNDVVFAPAWEQQLTVINAVEIDYDAGGVATAADTGSQALFGVYPETIQTTLASALDAQARANQRVARRAYPRWIMGSAPLLRGYREVAIGHTAIVHDLPDAAPYADWQPVIEGWEDRVNGSDWEMSLALSDPFLSGLSLTWNQAPGRWNTIDPTVQWRDAQAPSDLVPLRAAQEVAA